MVPVILMLVIFGQKKLSKTSSCILLKGTLIVRAIVINKSQNNNKEFDYLESIFVISSFYFLFVTVLTK